MTTPSERLAGAERRLHPLSWLFVLLASLREFAVPLIAVLFLGRRGNDTWELFGLIGVLALTAHAVVQYFTYRFRIDRDALVIRSGVLQRTLRHVPFRRIHDVTLHRNPLHRLFGVAEVRLESAGGHEPEARMRVLRLDDAQALEALLRRHARPAGGDGEAVSPAPEGEPLLALSTAEVVRLGLISNRGMILLAAGFGAFAQSGSAAFGDMTRALARPLFDWADGLAPGPLPWLLGGLALFLAFALLLRLLSVALALLQFHGFVLRDLDGRLQVDGGLLTRVRANAPPHRIQAFHLRESLLHRWFGRRSLRVDTAVVDTGNGGRSLRELAPIATPAVADALIRRLLPRAGWPDLPWRPLHPRAWRRMFTAPALLTGLATFVATLRLGADGLWLLLLLPWWWLRARKLAACARYAVGEALVAVQTGWLDRRWRVAEIGKLQALRLTRSPFDRRHGMATLWFDTAGARPTDPPLCIRYLPEDEARRILAEVGARIAASRLRW